MQENDRYRRRSLDARVVKQEARGRWLGILDSLAYGLSPAIQKVGRHVPCPVHGGKDGFRLYKNAAETGGGVCNTCGNWDDGIALLMWYNEWSFPETIKQVGGLLGLDPDDVHHAPAKPRASLQPVEETEADRKKREYKDRKVKEELNRVWGESLPLSAPEAEPVRLYFARRGLRIRYALESPILRFHPRMPYYVEGKIQGEFPCMLALVFDAANHPVTIHRTWLTEEGFKAPVEKPKKLMPYPSDRNFKGGGIPLVDVAQYIDNCGTYTAMGVTEGIETALAVFEASGGKLPVWPLISDRIMEKFQTPEVVDFLCVYGDQDVSEAGLNAARLLKERTIETGKEACGWLPPADLIPEGAKGVDWLDVLNREGPEAIPMPEGLVDEAKKEAYG